MSWYEEERQRQRQSPAGYWCVYRVHRETGHVVAYGPERDAARPGLWIASHYDKHPADHKDAMHLEHLAADSSYGYLHQALEDWAEQMDAQHARDTALRQVTETAPVISEE